MREKPPLVSIGIPTYNRANSSLPETLKSVLNQDYPDIEIVISDNCSTDQTEEYITSINDPRIKYIRQATNIGPTNNYNACLNAATGDYFLLLHDDDLIDADLVSTCMNAANYNTGFGLVRTGTRIIDSDGNVTKEMPNGVQSDQAIDLYNAWLTGKTAFYLCSTLYNTRALKEIGGFRSRNNVFEDGIAIIKISHQLPTRNVTAIKGSYRLHPDQRSGEADVLFWCQDFKQAIDLICLNERDNCKELYQKALPKVARIVIRFAKRIDNPFQQALTLLKICKYYPYKYWPYRSYKLDLIGFLGLILYPEKRPYYLK